ncbi:hypothetical protein FBU30_006497 [Linnemannia zychae]|nr:hypothetical protein FBU30_006497 [Linnemannia zychae]
MPSIIRIDNHYAPSELDLLSDGVVATSSLDSNSTNTSMDNSTAIKEMKESERRRRQWLDPEDEFSVPIHTELPLITKSPLDMSSFLLNYRSMRRSVEIMTPSSSLSQSKRQSASTTHLHPSLPDGPIYIHHRSTLADTPLSSAISSCRHLQKTKYQRQSVPPSTRALDCRMDRVLSNSAGGAQIQEDQDQYDKYMRLPSSSSHTSKPRYPSPATETAVMTLGEQSYLESHIASISQWLTSNAV